MSGPLVGLVREHGPRDHGAWAVLTVIAEDLRGPTRKSCLSNEALARDARLSPATVKRALAVLVRGGWVTRTPGVHRGVASTYRIRLEAFPAEAVDALLERGSHRPPLIPEDLTEGGHTDPLSEGKGVTVTHKGGHTDPPFRPYKQPSSSPAPMLPGVITGVRSADDDEAHEALNGIPGVRPTRTVRELVGAHLEAGWDASRLNAALRAAMSGNPTNPMGCLTTALKDLTGTQPPRPKVSPWDLSSWCGECDQNNRWREDDDGTPHKCPTCHPALVGASRPDSDRDEKRHEDPTPITSAAPAAFRRMTSGDRRNMMRRVGR